MKTGIALSLILPGLLLAQAAPAGWTLKPAGAQIAVDTFPMSARVTPDKKFLLVLNGGFNPPSVSAIDLAASKETSRVPVPDGWLGLTLNKTGDRVYVGGGSKAAIYEFTLTNGVMKPSRMFPVVAEKDRTALDFIGDVQFAPDGHLLYAADLYRDSVVVINPQSGLILSRIKTGRRPYRIVFQPSGKRMYVSSWEDGTVGEYDTESGTRIANLRVAAHTTDMVWCEGEVEDQAGVTARLFVAAANTNNVYALGANESGDLRRLETIGVSLTPRQPLGVTPAGLGLSVDGKKLLVALSGINATAVVDISNARSQVTGLVPAGLYPMAAIGLSDSRMAVLNGHSATVQLVDIGDDAKLAAWTSEVMSNAPYRDAMLDDPGVPTGNPLRANGPIKHVIYVVSRPLLRRGDFTFNDRHNIEQQFLRLPGYRANSTNPPAFVSWSIAGIATDYVERVAQSFRRGVDDYDGQEPTNSPPAGYLWTAAAQAGISMRNYGFFAANLKTPEADGTQLADVRDSVLASVTDPNYRAFDPASFDMGPTNEFISELKDFEKNAKMPQLLLVSTGNDDSAVGALVEAVSKSRFWNDTAIFVVDMNSCLIASPWVKHGAADPSMYDQLSVLRTVEILLGLHPLTTFDAAARPMFTVFTNTPDPAPYTRAPR